METTPAYCSGDVTSLAMEFQNTSCPNDNTSFVGNRTSYHHATPIGFDIVTALVVIGVAGVLSNIPVLAVLFKKDNRKIATNIFLFNIAISKYICMS